MYEFLFGVVLIFVGQKEIISGILYSIKIVQSITDDTTL